MSPGSGGGGIEDGGDGVLGKLIQYNPQANTIEVRLEDNSARTVPAQRVTRSFARARPANGSRPRKSGSDVAASRSESAATKVHKALGQRFPEAGSATSASSSSLEPRTRHKAVDILPPTAEEPRGNLRSAGNSNHPVAPSVFGRSAMDPGMLV